MIDFLYLKRGLSIKKSKVQGRAEAPFDGLYEYQSTIGALNDNNNETTLEKKNSIFSNSRLPSFIEALYN